MSLEEKLSILSELIQFANVNGEIKESEYNFLLSVSKQIDIDKEVFDQLMVTPAPKTVLKTESQRIVQFHRLLLLMNVDQIVEDSEVERIHQLGLKMGLNLMAVKKVLDIMPNYENGIIPPNVLLDVFKTYYN